MSKHVGSYALLAGVMMMSVTASAQQIPVSKDYGVSQRPMTPTPAPTPMPAPTPTPTTPPSTATRPMPMDTARIVEVDAGDLELYRNATDANIVAFILAGDSLEIQMSQLALTRSSNPSVREFAQMMIDQHSRNSQNFFAMQEDEDIGISPMMNDPIGAQDRSYLNALRNMSGAAFDRAYIRAQVAHHDAAAAALQQMADQARDDDLEEDIEEQLLPVVRQHLARSRQIANQLGVNVSQYQMTPMAP